MVSTLLYFVLALVLLVVVHEYGHFQVARWCGVKVLRFSFGFGKVLARWQDKKGTEYAWSLIPLGGYVKMLDETESEVLESERDLAFNNQSFVKRIAIVLAGPLFNFLFAFIALWLVLVIGMYSLAPIVESVRPNSIAAQAGIKAKQEVIGLNEFEVNSWRDFQYALMPLIGSQETVKLRLKSLVDGHQSTITLSLAQWRLDDKKPDPLQSLGIEPFIPTIPAVIGEVVPNSPAEKIGLQVGDILFSLNGKALDDWMYLVDFVRAHPDTQLVLGVKRAGKIQSIAVRSGSQKNHSSLEGFLGLRPKKVDWPSHWLRLEREGPIPALGLALKQTLNLSKTTVVLMARLLTGKLGIKSISGPVGIAQGAGDSGRSGFVYYLYFLALVSVSLGVLNLLPIPMLDGGHLLYYALELIWCKPLPDRVKSLGLYLGLIVLMALMGIALTNDLSRLAS